MYSDSLQTHHQSMVWQDLAFWFITVNHLTASQPTPPNVPPARNKALLGAY